MIQKDWRDFIKQAITQGDSQRNIVVSMRENKRTQKHEVQPGTPLATPEKTPKRSKKQLKDEEELDRVFDAHITEELKSDVEDKRAKSNVVLSPTDISHLRDKKTERVSEILHIPYHIAQKLLDHVEWDEDKLLAQYFENKSKLLVAASIDKRSLTPRKRAKKKAKVAPVTQEPKQETCSTCFDDYPESEFSVLEACGHKFCNQCWGGFFESKISEGITVEIRCMHQGCTSIVPGSIVEKLISDEMKLKYSLFLTKEFVNHNKYIRWCPAPGCEYAITEAITECRSLVATCHCGNRICWHCQREAHPPINCKMLNKWNKLTTRDMGALGAVINTNLDVQTLEWLHKNTKSCPFCSSPIQKNDGCYYMQCSNCRKSFCWLCTKPWDTHEATGHFSCPTYNAGEEALRNQPDHVDDDSFAAKKKAIEDFEKLDTRKKSLLQKFTKYYPMFAEVAKSMESSVSNKEIEDLTRELYEKRAIIDSKFLHDAHLALKKAKESLKYSYIDLAFLNPDTKVDLFGFLQDSLKSTITQLTNALGKPVATLDITEVKKLTKLANTHVESLLQEVERTADDYWTKDRKKERKEVVATATPAATEKEGKVGETKPEDKKTEQN
uniref:RBR-type E3 ubiquitin transferase n=1 Tax=Arcella intermedia TaxID=1963864 RepID=A0A6B2KZZ2_9EUKA